MQTPHAIQTNAAARLVGLLDSAMDAIVTVDEAQNIVFYNRAAERIFAAVPASASAGPARVARKNARLRSRVRAGMAG